MRHLLIILCLLATSGIVGCASNSTQSEQANAQAEKTEMRCEKRAYSGSRLGVGKCRRVKVADEDGTY